MTVIVQEPLLEGDEANQTQIGSEEKRGNGDGPSESDILQLDGGFVTPDSNAFGHSFRDYDKESERRAGVQEFYRINHINQTYEYVGYCGKRRVGYDGHVWLSTWVLIEFGYPLLCFLFCGCRY
jgi:hypothetical protein